MNKFATWLAATAFLMLNLPVSADSVIHLWHCEIDEGSTTDDVMKLSEDWLEAAREMNGGKELRVLIEYPIAADAGSSQFTFVLVVPDTKTWGVFMQDYDNSAAAEVDEAWNEAATCTSSGIWQSIELGVE